MIIALANGIQSDDYLEHLGGKGYNLALLADAGIPIPDSLVVSHASNLSDLSPEDRNNLQRFVEQAGSLAVRSSALGEDGNKNSFAGIFDSYLNVAAKDVIGKIAAVRNSLISDRHRTYAEGKSINPAEKMSVVLQEMILPDFAGILATSNLLRDDRNIIILEAVRGLADSMAAGFETPTSIRVNKITRQCRVLQDGGQALTEPEQDEIVSLLLPYADQIESLYDIPMDIEWAIRNGEVFILQTRPLTGYES